MDKVSYFAVAKDKRHFGFATYLHLSASMSFPGVSKQRRIITVCCLTTAKASSGSRAWSSTGGGVVAMLY